MLRKGFTKIQHIVLPLIFLSLSACSGILRGVSLDSASLIEDSKPIVTNTLLSFPNGVYKASVSIPIIVGFSKDVLVSGIPYIELSTTPPAKAYFTSGSGTNGLVFTYTVSNGETSNKLDYVDASSLKLNGGSITSKGGTPANVDLPLLDQGDSLSGLGGTEKLISIDTTAPDAATSITWSGTSPSSSSSIFANWMVSTSTDFAYSRIDFFKNGTCSGSAPEQSILINDSSTQTWRFFGQDMQTYSFKIASFDHAGNSSISVCSPEMRLNTQPPSAATSMAWVETSPHYLNTTITASWTVSASTDVVNQKIQLYKNSTCTLTSGSQVVLNSASANSYQFNVSRGMSYYFKVTTVDEVGFVSISTCSPEIVMPNWVAGARGAIAAGRFHSCAIMSDGAYCWGSNSKGQIGNGTINASSPLPMPTKVIGLSNPQSIAAGYDATCAVSNGAAFCWGRNDSGGLGNNSTVSSGTPVQVQGLTSGVTKVAVGQDFACAIQNGGVKCWGNNQYGRLGNNSSVQSLIPVQAQGLTSGVTDLSVGGAVACAIRNGALLCWGYGDFGQIGNGMSASQMVPTSPWGGLNSGVTQVATGGMTTCAIQNGNLFCWGYNYYGALGNGTSGASPVNYPVSTGLTGVQEVSVGSSHVCAVIQGGVKCWGSNYYGELGSSTNYQGSLPNPNPLNATNLSSGVQTIVSGDSHNCVLQNGSMKCWGAAASYRLGNYSLSGSFNSPVQVNGILIGIQQVAAGNGFNCTIINGGAKCWGSNAFGQLGNGGGSDSATPVQVSGLSSGVQAIYTGGNHACALQNGTLYCWGKGISGQLGNGLSANSNIPVAVTGITNGVSDVVLGENHSCAILNGAARCWGEGSFGQLGNASNTSSSVSVEVAGFGSGVQKISVGANHTCAIRNGAAFCWGMNSSGQLGDGTLVDRNSPTAIASLNSEMEKIVAGGYSTCSVKSGGAYCWGKNNVGQLGVGTTTTSESNPVSITAFSDGVQNIALGGDFGCVLIDGSVRCWGGNASGQLATGNFTSVSSPTLVSGLSGVMGISAGFNHVLAVKDGLLKVWGSNSNNQLGNTTMTESTTPIDYAPF